MCKNKIEKNKKRRYVPPFFKHSLVLGAQAQPVMGAARVRMLNIQPLRKSIA